MELQCATTEITGDVTLQWALSTETCGLFVEYIIYASNDEAGPYVILDLLFIEATTTYTHVGADGTVTTWYYYVEALYDCPGYTITTSDTLSNLDPEAPVLDYVSVLADGVHIYWLPSSSAKTSAYIIYRDIGGFTAIDTVYGRYTTTYTDITSNAAAQVETYTLASMDACENVGPFNNDSHHTIFLTVTQSDCADELNLSWNLYDTWPAGVLNYTIYADVNGTGAFLAGTVSNTTTSYVYSGIDDGDEICVTVHATRSDNTAVSVSNEWCSVFEVVQPAEYNVMRNATVASPFQIDITWYPDESADLMQYDVQRSTDGGSFTTVFTSDVTDPVTTPGIYSDPSVSADAQSYYYKINTTDSCGT
ncbi:MAG: hypothetical protein H7X71_00210, partial [Chitinophagales bacterium]|nr:hypothetical protein [Chitinophagales bacterium]